MSKRFLILCTGFLILLVTGAVLVRAQSPQVDQDTAVAATSITFTYQGELQEGNEPANGSYNFEFAIFDALSGGQPVGAPVAVTGVQVENGRFAVPLNFDNLGINETLYLEVAVRPTGHGGNFTTLSPRQLITPDLVPAVDAPAGNEQETFQPAPRVPQSVLTRTVSVNTGAFLLDTDEPDIVMSTDFALVWAANSSDEAGFYMSRPADWDGVSPVQVRITFALGGNGAGTVNWRLKLNTYTPNSGEWLTNPGARDADTIVVFPSGPSWYRIYSQTFTLMPADFHGEPYWSLFFVRGNATNGETFAGNLYVMGADVIYQAAP